MRPSAAAVGSRAEHISLQSEPLSAQRAVRGPHRVCARLQWRNALRGIKAQFDLADDHYVQVRYLEPRRLARQYLVNLRFCATKPRRCRHIAWVMLVVTLAFAVAAIGMAFALMREALPLTQLFVGATIGLGSAAVASAALFLHRTTESLEFTSMHGDAPLIRLTGGPGSGRKAKAFCIELIKSINVAHANIDARSQTYLRDAMREHHRLRDVGALSEAEYEICKQRILAAHGA